MDNNIKRNFIYNLAYQLTIVILPLVTIPYVSRVLSPEGIGINSFTNANTQYFILFGTLGISLYANKTIAVIRDNKMKLRKTFWEIFSIQVIGCLISYIIFFITLVQNKDYGIYYLLQGFMILSYAIDISWYFIGIEDFKKASIRSILIRICSVILVFVFVKKSTDLWKYIFINTFINFVGQLIMWRYLDKEIINIKHIKKMGIKKHLLPVIGLFVPQIATQVYMVLDKTMTGLMTSTIEVGYYDQSQKIVRVVLAIVTSLGVVMLPRMSNLLANDKEDEAVYFLQKSFRFISFLAIPLAFGIIAISNRFIPIFLGQGYEKVVLLTIISSMMIIIIGLGNVFGTQYLLAKNRVREYTISVIVGAILNFTLNLVLIPKLFSVGAVISTVIAELVIAVIQACYSREILSCNWIKGILKYWASGFIMLVVVVGVGSLKLNEGVVLLLQILIGAITYFAIIIILKDSMILEFIMEIKYKFTGKQ